MHPAQEAQIAPLLTEEVTVSAEYSDFADVFLEESAAVLPKRTEINEHAIQLQKDQPGQWLQARRSSYPFRPEARRQTPVVCRLSRAQ